LFWRVVDSLRFSHAAAAGQRAVLLGIRRRSIIPLSLKDQTSGRITPAHFFWLNAFRDFRTLSFTAADRQARITAGTMSWQDALDKLTRTVTGMGYDLVDVERTPGGLLRVSIDRLPGQAYDTGPGDVVTVDDCEVVTRQLQFVLEVAGVDYARLEVASPGLDRPLKKLADWQRFTGVEVEITLREPFEGRKKWQGTLAAGDSDAAWRLVLPPPQLRPVKPGARVSAKAMAAAAALPQQVMDFELDEVREARLVPVVDFKGRRGQPEVAMPEAQTENTDGGQD
jgi:ribosome maturation factor RimP